MMSMTDLITIFIESPKIGSGYFLEKEFRTLIGRNHLLLLYLTINQVDSCHGCVFSPLN